MGDIICPLLLQIVKGLTKIGGNQSPNSLMLRRHCIVGHRHKYATMNPFNYKNVLISKWKKCWFLTVTGQKLIYSPELCRRDTIFLKLFFVEYFGIWGLYLPKLAKKSSSCVVDLTKTAKNITTISFFFALKLQNFNLIASQVFFNDQMIHPGL